MRPFAASSAESKAAPSLGGGGARQRVAWTIVDQALASASNIGTAVVAARSLDRQSFGAFGFAFTLYLLALGASRALITEPLLVRFSGRTDEPPHEVADRARRVSGAAAGFGTAFGLALLLASPLIGHAGGQALWAMAVVLPAVLVQDAWRYCFVADGKPRAALGIDGIWCIAQLVLLLPLAEAHAFNLVSVILWWGLSGAVAGVAGCITARTVPSLAETRSWIGTNWDLGGRFTAEYLSSSGAANGILIALGAISGLVALGAMRAVLVYFGPINVLFGGILLALVPEGARLRDNRQRLHSLMRMASAGLGALVVVWLSLGLMLPSAVGEALFGTTWSGARPLLVPVGVGLLGGAVAAGAMAGLRALGNAPASLRARLIGLPLFLSAPLIGTIDGARGFAVGLAGAMWGTAAIWWWQFELALREPPPALSVPTALSAPTALSVPTALSDPTEPVLGERLA